MTRRTTLTWTQTTDDGDEVEHELPARWAICSTCRGEGKHSLAVDGHGITEEEREREWSHDEWESYLAGGYDSACEDCSATGKVREVDLEALPAELRAAYLAHLEDEASYAALCRAERRMGA